MAHFFKYANRPLHKDTKEYKEREERGERQRKMGLAAGNDNHDTTEAKSNLLKKREEEKKLRAIAKKFKGRHKNALDKFKKQ